MKTLASLFENNRTWAARISQADPTFFSRLTQQQSPGFLWIGCSDSRVPANEIVGLLPGELFVHRNIANLVIHTDMNCLSVLQYAVDVLKIRDIIVCGHYGCGGVKTVFENQPHGLIDNWLRSVWNLRQEYAAELTEFATLNEQINRLCELNVIEQVKQVAHTTIIQEAWQRNQPVSIHGWIYAISDGLLQDLGAFVSSEAELSMLERQQ